VKEAIKLLGGIMVNSAPYHPQSNANVERGNGTIKHCVDIALVHMPKDLVRWNEIVLDYKDGSSSG